MAMAVYADVANQPAYLARVALFEEATLEEVVASDAARLQGARILDGEAAEFPPMLQRSRLPSFRMVWARDGAASSEEG